MLTGPKVSKLVPKCVFYRSGLTEKWGKWDPMELKP